MVGWVGREPVMLCALDAGSSPVSSQLGVPAPLQEGLSSLSLSMGLGCDLGQ